MSNCNHCGGAAKTVVATTESGLVMRCSCCGLEYREFACEPRNVYRRPGKLSEPTHVARQRATLKYLQQMVGFPLGTAIEVGSGAGVFAGMLAPHVGEICCIEPSEPMVEVLRRMSGVKAYPGNVGAIVQFRGVADLAIALGVHYLFRDHAKAVADIAAALRPGGYFYLESNVFLDTKGFVGEKFRTKKELYTHNPMVAYWFTPELLVEQLERHFVVKDRRENTYGGSLVRGFLCQKVEA